MNRWLIEAIEGWFRFPRVVLLYVFLYVLTAIPMFTSDPGNPARAFSFALMLWITLTVVSVVVATIVVTLGKGLRKNGLFGPIFNAAFIVTWIVVFGVLYN